jgi:hypothetical protein
MRGVGGRSPLPHRDQIRSHDSSRYDLISNNGALWFNYPEIFIALIIFVHTV